MTLLLVETTMRTTLTTASLLPNGSLEERTFTIQKGTRYYTTRELWNMSLHDMDVTEIPVTHLTDNMSETITALSAGNPVQKYIPILHLKPIYNAIPTATPSKNRFRCELCNKYSEDIRCACGTDMCYTCAEANDWACPTCKRSYKHLLTNMKSKDPTAFKLLAKRNSKRKKDKNVPTP